MLILSVTNLILLFQISRGTTMLFLYRYLLIEIDASGQYKKRIKSNSSENLCTNKKD